MTASQSITDKLPINLGDGLVLRRSTVQDAEAFQILMPGFNLTMDPISQTSGLAHGRMTC
jgi:hypothetical protein